METFKGHPQCNICESIRLSQGLIESPWKQLLNNPAIIFLISRLELVVVYCMDSLS